jgi:hypothetical protein
MSCDSTFYVRSGVIPLAFYRMLRNERIYHRSAGTPENRSTSCLHSEDAADERKTADTHLHVRTR